MKLVVALLIVLAVVPASLAADAPVPNDYGPLPTIGAVSTASRIEPRLSAVATNLAGRTVEARCWSVDDWARLDREWIAYSGEGITGVTGYVRHSARGRLHLSPRTCSSLAQFVYAKARPTNKAPVRRDRLASALLTLGHEAQHSASIDDEKTAECRGVQLVRPVARMLGATRDYAAFIAVSAWRHNYGSTGGELKSPECRNGGTLDLNPTSAVWP